MSSLRGTDALRKLLNSITPLPENEWRWLEATLRPCEFSKDEALVRTGTHEGGIHFLRSGLVRYFYLKEDGNEWNHTFAAAETLVGCFPCLVGATSCPFTVAALESTRTLLIEDAVVSAFPNRHPCWMQLWTRLMEHVALRKTAREQSFLLDSAEQRYLRFLRDYADIAHRIPQYHIASWLGITPVALSRIRRRIN
ncbi:MAG: Crp/Fnr family transcriptional regulator [Sideroxyarcus sp.]|nr:Crp/Fnr family transcriptional regulator [Sideroxyarcus sp.]